MQKIIYKYNDVYDEPHESLRIDIECLSLYFSSTTNMKRFHKKLEDITERMKRWIIAYSLEDVNLRLVQVLKAYEEVEKRGFKIEQIIGDKVVGYKCRKEMTIGLHLRKRS